MKCWRWWGCICGCSSVESKSIVARACPLYILFMCICTHLISPDESDSPDLGGRSDTHRQRFLSVRTPIFLPFGHQAQLGAGTAMRSRRSQGRHARSCDSIGRHLPTSPTSVSRDKIRREDVDLTSNDLRCADLVHTVTNAASTRLTGCDAQIRPGSMYRVSVPRASGSVEERA